MAVVIDFSVEAEELLKAEWGDLSQAAREALVIESYRQGKLSVGQCGKVLGMSFSETEAFLRDRGVPLGLTIEEFNRDLARLKGLLK